jgi:hypothetical protein
MALIPSPLCPDCKAKDRLILWRGINKPPHSMLEIPIIWHIEGLASQASLRDSTNYGSGLHKFHLFCDIFSIPESHCLPASLELIHSFALWAATDPIILDPAIQARSRFEPVSTSVVRKYLAAIWAWHIIQGWPATETPNNHSDAVHLESITHRQYTIWCLHLGHGLMCLLGNDAIWRGLSHI